MKFDIIDIIHALGLTLFNVLFFIYSTALITIEVKKILNTKY